MKKALGRGLSSLIPDTYVATIAAKEEGAQPKAEGFELIPVANILPNPDQPREIFSEEGIDELAQSIREKGIMQPVIVRKAKGEAGNSGKYELVCGERRFRAATRVGLERIPSIIKDLAQDELLEWALVENIQREDLNPLEEGHAYEKLIVERGLSQEEIAKRVGKGRSTIANSLRLLRLPDEVIGLLRNGQLSAGHARTLLGLFTPEQQIQLARRILKENLSVRQVEDIVMRSAKKRRARLARRMTPEIADLETRLARLFGTPVRIHASKNQTQGRIVIHYFSLDELDRVLAQIKLPPG